LLDSLLQETKFVSMAPPAATKRLRSVVDVLQAKDMNSAAARTSRSSTGKATTPRSSTSRASTPKSNPSTPRGSSRSKPSTPASTPSTPRGSSARRSSTAKGGTERAQPEAETKEWDTVQGAMSPGQTSDYDESETPKSGSPVQVASTEDSRSVTPAALVVPDSGHVSPSSGQVSPVEKSPEAAKLRRASGDGGSKDADASCLLDDEEAEALAVKQSGLISEDALKEEAAAAEDNVKRQQKSTDDQIDVTNISSEDRYNMLMELLNKSEFFTNYIKEKMAEKLAVQEKEVKKSKRKEVEGDL